MLPITGEDVYLRIGENFRGSLDPMQFAALFTAMTGEGDGSALDTDALLEQLGSGTFVVAEDGRSASLALGAHDLRHGASRRLYL